eukprot:385110-Pelagomonas_calceolata.AAC.1
MPEQIAGPPTNKTNLDNLVKQGFEGNPRNLSSSPWLSTTGCAIRKNVTFNFQPTNPQTDIMPIWKCEILVRTVNLMTETHRSPSDEDALPIQMPEVLPVNLPVSITQMANALACSP